MVKNHFITYFPQTIDKWTIIGVLLFGYLLKHLDFKEGSLYLKIVNHCLPIVETSYFLAL